MGLSSFNTSHVSINRLLNVACLRLNLVSIHLMFLLIKEKPATEHGEVSFNTSHVSINR